MERERERRVLGVGVDEVRQKRIRLDRVGLIYFGKYGDNYKRSVFISKY